MLHHPDLKIHASLLQTCGSSGEGGNGLIPCLLKSCLCLTDPGQIRKAGRSLLSRDNWESLNPHSVGFWQLEKHEKCTECLMAAECPARQGLGASCSLARRRCSLPCCPHAHALQEI